MTQEDKELLLKDLCARLLYGVKVQYNNKKEIFGDVEQIETGGDIDLSYYDEEAERWKLYCTSIDNIKPYLRSMSSMTDEEQRILDSMCNSVEMVSRLSGLKMFDKAFDWLNKNHFDYRGLIEKGLAIDATGLNIY